MLQTKINKSEEEVIQITVKLLLQSIEAGSEEKIQLNKRKLLETAMRQEERLYSHVMLYFTVK
jgi:hypothetical protein